jgi:hypothetical protein
MNYPMYIYSPKTGYYISRSGLTQNPDKNCIWNIIINSEKPNSFGLSNNSSGDCFGIDSANSVDFSYDCKQYPWLSIKASNNNLKSSFYLKCTKFYLSINNQNELVFENSSSIIWQFICPGTWKDWQSCTNCPCKQIKEYICNNTEPSIWSVAEPKYKTDCQGSWSNWSTCKDNKQTRTYTHNPKKCGLGTPCNISSDTIESISCDSNQVMYYNNVLSIFFSQKNPNINVNGYIMSGIPFITISSKFDEKKSLVQIVNVNNPDLQSSIRNNDQIYIKIHEQDGTVYGYLAMYGKPGGENNSGSLMLTQTKEQAQKFLIKTIESSLQEIVKGTPFILIPILNDEKNYSIKYNKNKTLEIFETEYDTNTFFKFYDKDGIPPSPPGPSPPGPSPPGPSPPGPSPPGPSPPGPSPPQNRKTLIIAGSIVGFIILCIILFLVLYKK